MREIRDPELSLHVTVWETIQRLKPTNALILHIPNGMWRDWQTAKMLQLMGVMPGAPDFLVLVRGGVAAFIELKAGKGSLSKEQRAFREICSDLGFCYEVCRTLEAVLFYLEQLSVCFTNSIDLDRNTMKLGGA